MPAPIGSEDQVAGFHGGGLSIHGAPYFGVPLDDESNRLGGMAMGTGGIEVWISNTRTREWRTMTRGQSVLGARFLDAQPLQERAVFEIDGKLYEFFTNGVLNERTEIPESDRPT